MPLNIKIGEPFKLSDQYGCFPQITKLQNGDVFVAFNTGADRVPDGNEDARIANEEPQLIKAETILDNNRKYLNDLSVSNYLASWALKSTDGGKSFHDWGIRSIYLSESDTGVVGIGSHVYRGNKKYIKIYRSKDGCGSWDGPEYAEYTGPPTDNKKKENNSWSIIISRSAIRLPDGSSIISAYGRFEGDNFDRTFILKTTDNFKSLYYYATIACVGAAKESSNYNEPVMSFTADGKTLICVMRTEGFSPIVICRSVNYGATWSPPEYAGADGVFPDLCLLQNGVMACSYGRPDVAIMFSDDDGRFFRYRKMIYHMPEYQKPQSCCYTGIREIAPNRLLMVFSAPDGLILKPDSNNPWHNLKDYRIYGVTIDVEKVE